MTHIFVNNCEIMVLFSFFFVYFSPVRGIPSQGSFSDLTVVTTGEHMRVCQSFDWFLGEIYPGLLVDSDKVLERYVSVLCCLFHSLLKLKS